MCTALVVHRSHALLGGTEGALATSRSLLHTCHACSGEVRAPLQAITRLPLNERKIIAHRAFLEVDAPHCLVNLGVGIPEVSERCSA